MQRVHTNRRVRNPRCTRRSCTAHAYVGFEDRFRGSEGDIRAGWRITCRTSPGSRTSSTSVAGAASFSTCCGTRASPRGLDLNPEMVEVCRARGLDATTADARGYLQGLADESLGGLIAVQVIEHLEPAYLTQVLGLAFDKVRPGGRIVLETINPRAGWRSSKASFAICRT